MKPRWGTKTVTHESGYCGLSRVGGGSNGGFFGARFLASY